MTYYLLDRFYEADITHINIITLFMVSPQNCRTQAGGRVGDPSPSATEIKKESLFDVQKLRKKYYYIIYFNKILKPC